MITSSCLLLSVLRDPNFFKDDTHGTELGESELKKV